MLEKKLAHIKQNNHNIFTSNMGKFDVEDFNNFCQSYYQKKNQIDLKEYLLKKFLMKLVKKEIDRVETCKYVYTLHPFEKDKLIILDKSMTEIKPLYAPIKLYQPMGYVSQYIFRGNK
jgi:hypothetical protein